MLITNNCYFNIQDLSLDESLDIIEDLLLQISENRSYFVYNLKTIFASKEELENYSYKDFLIDKGLIRPVQVDKEKVINKANEVAKEIKNNFALKER